MENDGNFKMLSRGRGHAGISHDEELCELVNIHEPENITREETYHFLL
jgi:hypothetical protein